jgi:hypothetical protein
MPRNSTSITRKNTIHPVSPLAPAIPTKNSPSLGSTLVESMTSGLGSGVGFGLGSSLVRSMFGSSPSPSVNNDYEQCLEANKHNLPETTCYHLSNRYKACMVRTNYNRGECTRDM